MFEKKLEAGRHILTGKPIPLMRDGEEISGGYARWARAGRHSSSRPEGLFVYSGHCVGNGYGLLYGDNVFEKDGIRRDRTGDGEKTRCLCGKQGIFNRDGPAMGPQIIR